MLLLLGEAILHQLIVLVLLQLVSYCPISLIMGNGVVRCVARRFRVNNNDNTVWLQQRPPQGIWGGLWSFPELEREDDSAGYIQQRFGRIIRSDNWACFRHTFSHYHLNIQ